MDKIKIRMPTLTRDRLEADYQTFFLGDDIPSFNAFVCSLLLSMYENRQKMHKERVRRIYDVLGDKRSLRKAEEILSSLDSSSSDSQEMPLDYSLSLRPSKSEEILFEEMGENGLSGSSLSSYLRGLLEEYFSLFFEVKDKDTDYDYIVDLLDVFRKDLKENGFVIRPECEADDMYSIDVAPNGTISYDLYEENNLVGGLDIYLNGSADDFETFNGTVEIVYELYTELGLNVLFS